MIYEITDKDIFVGLILIILFTISVSTAVQSVHNRNNISKIKKNMKIEAANESKAEQSQELWNLEEPYMAYATVEINTNDGSQYYALVSYRDVQKLDVPHEKITIWDNRVGYERLMTDRIESYVVQ